MYRRPILWTLYNALDFLKVLKIAVVGGGGGVLLVHSAYIIASVVDIGGKLSLASLLLAVNYRCCHCYQRLIISGVIDTVNKLIADIMGLMKIWGTIGIIAGINDIKHR